MRKNYSADASLESLQTPEENIGIMPSEDNLGEFSDDLADEQAESANDIADAVDAEDELIVPPADPVATANLISMIDPDKVEQEEIDVIAEATGSSPEFVEKVVSLVARSVEDAEETTAEAAQENYSNRVYRLCSRVSFSAESVVIEGKSEEEKLTEVVDIIPTFADSVLESVDAKEIADTFSAATGVDAEAAEAIVNVAKSHNNEAVAEATTDDALEDLENLDADEAEAWEDIQENGVGDTYIEDNDEYQTPMSDPDIDDKVDSELSLSDGYNSTNFSYEITDIVDDVSRAWDSTRHDLAVAGHRGAKKMVKALTDNPVVDDLKHWNKVSLQPAIVKVQKTIAAHPGATIAAAVSPLAIGALVANISDIVSYKAAAEEEESLGNGANAEALDNAAISTGAKASVSLANAARIHMSRHFSAAFASDVYPADNRMYELDSLKEDLGNKLYDIGAFFNEEQGFWSGLSDYISKYRVAFGGALASLLTLMLPKFVSVNGSQIIVGAKNEKFFSKLSNIFNHDPAWIKSLRSIDRYLSDNPKTTAAAMLIALGSAVVAWAKSSDISADSLPPRVRELLAKIKYDEIKIADLESQLGSDVATDLAVSTQPMAVVQKNFSNVNFNNAELDTERKMAESILDVGQGFGGGSISASPDEMFAEDLGVTLPGLNTEVSEASVARPDILTADQKPVQETDGALNIVEQKLSTSNPVSMDSDEDTVEEETEEPILPIESESEESSGDDDFQYEDSVNNFLKEF